MQIIILNDYSEYKTFLKLQRLGVLPQHIKSIIRIKTTEAHLFEELTNSAILWISITNQKWIRFLRSAAADLKEHRKLLCGNEINLYIFSRYDPIIHFLASTLNIKCITELYQLPFYEARQSKITLQKKIKSKIKSFSLYLYTGRKSYISYRSGLHEINPIMAIPTNAIKLYPTNENSVNIKFGNFKHISDCTNDRLVFFTQPLYLLDKVDKNSFIDDNIRFLKKFRIREVCFHPRQSNEFRLALIKEFPEISFYNGISEVIIDKDYLPVSVGSTVCFDSVLSAKDAILVPDFFPSVRKIQPLPILTNYLDTLSYGD